METKIIWHFNSEKKRRGTTFAKKEEYLLALDFEPQELVDKEFKKQIKAFLKAKYHVTVHQLTYNQFPLHAVCKLFGDKYGLCKELNITIEQLCDLNLNFTNPHIKSQMLISHLLPVLTDQQFANWFYSTVMNLYLDTKEPVLIYPNTLTSDFYKWLHSCGYYKHLNQYMLGIKIPNAMMIGDYIYEHRGEYNELYTQYAKLLKDFFQSHYSYTPIFINNLRERTTVKLKRHNVLIIDKLEHMGTSYKTYMSMFYTISPKMTDTVELISQEVGFNKYDFLYSLLLNTVEYYAKKPSYKRGMYTERNVQFKL